MRLRRMLLPLAFLAPLLLLTYPTAVPGASLANTRAPAAPGTMATDPLVIDLQALVDGSAELYSGLWVDEETNTVFVGSVGPDGDRQVQAVAGRYPTAPTSAQVSPVRVARSSADLSAIRNALLHDPSISTLLAPVYSYDGPLAQTGQVELGIVRASPSLVGYDDVAFAGASIDVTVTVKRPWTRALSVAALGCPVDPTPGSASQRPPLPPGDYQVVAVLSNRTSRVVGNPRGVTL